MEIHNLAPELEITSAQKLIRSSIGSGFGELYLESARIDALSFDQNRLSNNQSMSHQGMGLRRVMGAETQYAHSESLSKNALEGLVASIGHSHGTYAPAPMKRSQATYYSNQDIPPLAERLALMQIINETVRALDPRIINVSITLAASHQDIAIIGAEAEPLLDTRPMCRIGVGVTVEENGRRESGNSGKGGRFNMRALMSEDCWLALGKESLRIALVNLTAQPCPAGEQMLLLGPGWPGVLFHEAVGHGLEGDFNRRGSSAFSKLVGKQVAAKGVNVVDDGTIIDARGSIHFDDEGTPTQRNTLIEDGKLVGYMQDRLNGDLMGTGTSGNCRRESYAHPPMPRMTNTFLDNGSDSPDDLRAELKSGIYAVGFGGGQVDITSGKFVFNCTEAYRVENGEVLYPVKGATLIGDGPTALHKIIGIGNDMALDPGIGNCGKAGQWLPVCVGQPTVLMEGITIGGTEI